VTVRDGRAAGGRRDMDELGLSTAALGLSGPSRVTRSEQGCCPVHDTVEKAWRHPDFFQHRELLHARLPWARPGSGFTLLFEALVLTFAAAMSISKVGAMTRA
jgi:Helix-turn-helix domain of transposase family ISL3